MSNTIGGGNNGGDDSWPENNITVPDQYPSPIKNARARKSHLRITAPSKLQVIFSRTT